MKVRFLFYRAKFEFRNFLRTRQIRLVDDLISWWTWLWNIGTGPYGHSEVWLPDKDGVFNSLHWPSSIKIIYQGTCYTSTLRGEANGTVKRPASKVIKHPERWDYKEFDIPEDLFIAGKEWLEQRVKQNKGYDKKAVLSFLTPWRFHDLLKYICSEHGQNYAVIVAILHLPYMVVSPRRLARMLPGKMQRLK